MGASLGTPKGSGGRLTDRPVVLRRRQRNAVRARSLDLSGDVYGRLTVIKFAGHSRQAGGSTRRLWECRCSCGKKLLVPVEDLRSGNTKSCGCLARRAKREAVWAAEIDARAATADSGFWARFGELASRVGRDVLRARWPGTKLAFGEIFEKRRRVPDAVEAEQIAEMLVLRGFDRDGFLRLCFEARLRREKLRDEVERRGKP